MNNHKKKMIAPIIITILFVLYYVGITILLLTIDDLSSLVKFLLIVVPLAFAGVMIGVLISRIKEIRSGEEDDLSQY